MHRSPWLARTSILLALLAAPRPPATAQEPPAAGPMFEVAPSEGPTVAGSIEGLDAEGLTIQPVDGARATLPWRRVVRVSRAGEGRAAGEVDRAYDVYVVLPDGDRLPRAAVGAAGDDKVEVRSRTFAKMTVPVDAILGLAFNLPPAADAGQALARRLRSEPRTGEVLWLANGDRATGSFLGLDDKVVRLQVDGKPAEYPRKGVAALGFDPALTSYPRPEGDWIEATLTDGGRLGLSGLKLEKGRLSAQTRFGAKVTLPPSAVARLVPRTPEVDYLSDRPADGKSYVSYFDETRPHQVDSAVDGLPFRLGGRTYDRGIGTQSRTLLAYKLKPGDARFQALVGVDERAGPLGSVVFRVMTDDKSRYASPPLTFRDAPQAVDVDLQGAKLLILITEFGERADVQDLADWVDARIIRKP